MIYKINMVPGRAIQTVRVSQGDTSLRRFIFRLKYLTSDYALTDERVEFIQSNGAIHQCSIVNGLAVLDAFADMTAKAGHYIAKLRITNSGEVTYSAMFDFIVEVAA